LETPVARSILRYVDRMHTLIQSRANKSYFDFGAKRWINHRPAGTVFDSELEAIRACMREGLARVQLVLLSDDSEDELVIPFDRDARSRPNSRVSE
jgi:hypothetical protein